MLTKDEELALIRAWQDNRDQRAFNRIRDAFRPWLLKHAMGVARKHMHMVADIDQLADIALFRAVDQFDESLGTRLATYLHWQFRQEMQNNVTFTKRRTDKRRMDRELTHFALNIDGLAPNGLPWADVIADEGPATEDVVAQRQQLDLISAAMDALKPKERIVVLRAIEHDQINAAAGELGFSRQRASQIYHASIDKIRRHIATQHLMAKSAQQL